MHLKCPHLIGVYVKGFNIEAKASLGRTVLHRAAELVHEEVVRRLLERGADVEAKDNYERTALLRAAEWGLRKWRGCCWKGIRTSRRRMITNGRRCTWWPSGGPQDSGVAAAGKECERRSEGQ